MSAWDAIRWPFLALIVGSLAFLSSRSTSCPIRLSAWLRRSPRRCRRSWRWRTSSERSSIRLAL